MIRFFLLVLTYNFCLVKSQTLPPPPGLPPVPSPPGLPPVSPPPGLPPVDILVKGQTLPPPGLPPVDAFLSWLFNAASNEIDNIGNNFDFHEVSPKDITFVLYLPPNADKTVILNPENLTFIDPSKPTKIMIHGWQASGLDDSNKDMARKYHQNGDYNFIAVDWSEHAKKVYMHSAGSTKDIGHILGNFIYKLIKKDAKFLPNIHLLGVSLGGHVAGFAGKKIQELTGKKIGRITGLDVASPLFEMPTRRSSKNRLSEYDAEFVDVIHTNAGFLGVSDAIGTADFYVENGGPMQPGCFDPLNMVESFSCSHFKAVEYFMESIDGKKFEALSCPNSIEYHILACNGNKKVIMGERVSRSARGPFYLEKESPLPYGKLLDNPLGIKINTPKFRIPFVN